jgi:PAS domain S-box-containing protein
MDDAEAGKTAALESRITELSDEVRELRRLNARLRVGTVAREQQLEAGATLLHDSERYLGLLIDAVMDYAIFMLDKSGTVVSWNPGAQRIKGYEPGEIIGGHFSCFYTEADRAAGVPARALEQATREGKYELEGWRVRKDGSVFWANVVITAIRDEKSQLIGFAKVTRDLTERRANEQRLRQAQKMEAVGQLTGGVAHDFNNMLTVVIGNIENMRRRLQERSDPALERLANAALHGAQRGALLVHRLLAFSRSQPLQPRVLSVNTLVAGMSEMLRRTLGETIQIETVLAGGIWPIFCDATEVESALLNLAINARDAMPDGGRLTIEAANVFLDEPYARDAEIAPGQYVGVFVSDTGIGMPTDVVAKAFDPFFTTKEPGVLVVEDDADVRSFVIETLQELAYKVVVAADGAEGPRLLDAHREIAALLTDVGLPGGMNGRQLADEAKRWRSGLKVLFMSGYARNAIVHHGRLDSGVELLTKPFTFAALGMRIRQLLDGRQTAAQPLR